MKRRRVCKAEGCNRTLGRNNVSGFCSSCSYRERAKKYRKKQKERKKCFRCGKKVNPIITYPDGEKGPKIIKYPYKCYKCRKKDKK
ncbi:MAG: hypothetical protein ACOC1P_03120 [Minisyncoccales bacterium]